LKVAAGLSSNPKRKRRPSKLLRTQKACETRDGMRVICWPIVERYLRSRNDFRLEPLLNLELQKRMVQVAGQRIGAIGLALTERLVMAPPVVALAPLSGPAASAPR
jgi:hypothetical protein